MRGQARAAAAGAVVLVMLVGGCGSDEDDDEARRRDTSDDVLGTFAAAEQPASTEELDAAVEVMERRVEALHVGRVDVRRDGDQIVVRIDDPHDREAVLPIVGVLGELRFRPVLMESPTTGDKAKLDQTFPVTSPTDDEAGQTVVLETEDRDIRYELGPALASDRVVETAEASLGQTAEWQVRLTLEEGPDGIDGFNGLAGQCFQADPDCPTGKIAIVFDSVVESAPTVQEQSYRRDQIQISGAFTKQEAEDLAVVLASGTLPIRLERQTVQQAG